MSVFWPDIKFAFRVLLHNRGFAAVAILTLALGIGANTALFSVVNGVLLNRLPLQDPDRVYALYAKTETFERGSIAYPNFLDWVKENHSFSFLAALSVSETSGVGQSIATTGGGPGAPWGHCGRP